MPTPRAARRQLTLLCLVVVAVAAPLGIADDAEAAPAPLTGTFAITAGTCSGGVSGSYLRMVLPTGTLGGPFLSNADSACDDQTFTLLAPGTDGGLITGAYQPNPSPPFDGAGNSVARRITAPTGFFGVAFSTSTNAVDPQTGLEAAPPVVTVDGTTLAGDLSSFAASWNNQEFNQGAPKPNGSSPGNTTTATGTYDPATGAFTLEWASQVEGGPFDRFTGLWHLEGRFVPAAAGGAPAPAPAPAAAAESTSPPPAPAGGAAIAPAAGAGATTTTATGDVAAAPADGGDSGLVAAPNAVATPGETVRTEVGEDGWAPPAALVIVIALLGLAASVTYIRLDRTVRALEVPS